MNMNCIDQKDIRVKTYVKQHKGLVYVHDKCKISQIV